MKSHEVNRMIDGDVRDVVQLVICDAVQRAVQRAVQLVTWDAVQLVTWDAVQRVGRVGWYAVRPAAREYHRGVPSRSTIEEYHR